ncbi:hypothetical protein Lal_00045603 [Lupinus albus]|nr:hypothetical protein Lal_00045603 [Lupinus albus]
MPFDPNEQDPHESFFKLLQFLAKASIPESVSSRHARSLRRVRLGQRAEMRTSASSHMLTDLRSHLRASFVTESNRENSDGMNGRRSVCATRERRSQTLVGEIGNIITVISFTVVSVITDAVDHRRNRNGSGSGLYVAGGAVALGAGSDGGRGSCLAHSR